MTLADHHASLAVHPVFSILGVRLGPLSVAHAKLLPALGLDQPERMEEVLACALVCSTSAETALHRLQSRVWRWIYAARGLVVGLFVRILSGRSKAAQHVITLAVVKRWMEYVEHYKAVPRSAPVRHGEPGAYISREIHTPNLAHVEHMLCSCGYAPEAVNRMPLNEALWRFSVAKEAANEVTLIDELNLTEDEYDAQQRFADENEAKWKVIAGGVA